MLPKLEKVFPAFLIQVRMVLGLQPHFLATSAGEKWSDGQTDICNFRVAFVTNETMSRTIQPLHTIKAKYPIQLICSHVVKLGSRSKVNLKSLIRDLDLELVAIIAHFLHHSTTSQLHCCN